MSSQHLGLLIGGLLPALCYGLSGVFAKVSTNAGIALGPYLVLIGVMVSVVGLVTQLLVPGPLPSGGAIAAASLFGTLWGIGTGLVGLGLLRYQVPLSKLVPLYNMNTLVTVVLALIIFQEGQAVNLPLLLLGAVLVVAGGILVSIA